jgi:hypothetical protein
VKRLWRDLKAEKEAERAAMKVEKEAEENRKKAAKAAKKRKYLLGEWQIKQMKNTLLL